MNIGLIRIAVIPLLVLDSQGVADLQTASAGHIVVDKAYFSAAGEFFFCKILPLANPGILSRKVCQVHGLVHTQYRKRLIVGIQIVQSFLP